MKKIYFDESGNTGADLLNKEQKLFTLCSNTFTEYEAEKIKSIFRHSSELHFVQLKKSSAGRKAIIEMLNHDLIREEKIIIYIVDKEFATVAQIVNHLVETFYYHRGTDINKNNLQVEFTNMIYFFGKYQWDKITYAEFLASFIYMFKDKSLNSITKFYDNTQSLFNVLNNEDKALIGPVLGSYIYIDEILKYADKFTLDVTLSTFLVLCDSWYNVIKEPFNVVFDNSHQLKHYRDYIDFVSTMEVPIQKVGFGARKITFPLQINNISLTDSHDEFNIQISDIIASAVSFSYNNKNPKYQSFVSEIKNSKIFKLNNTHSIFPAYSHEIRDDNTEGQNILDFLATQSIIYMKKKT